MGIQGWSLDIGASLLSKEKVSFRVWAPLAESVSVEITSQVKSRAISIRLRKDESGYFAGAGEGISQGDSYFYVIDRDGRYPDPASRFQPRGVHGPSQVIDPLEFKWEDEDWKAPPLRKYVIYELHVGTFSGEGTFDAVIPYLEYMKDLGITAVELMPVAQFPGERNWGYDGAYPFAPQNSYGGPQGLKTLINACHKKGLAVILDVVYNHLGPEGNYLRNFGPYFTDRYRTPWGDAVNFDGPYSDEVKWFFISNALYWIKEYHVDALRVDAVHGIFDMSARHFLQELGEAVGNEAEPLGGNVHVIVESDLNDVRLINPVEIGGYGLHGTWNDDFHHALHSLITNENNGYYKDFGELRHIAKAFREGFVYSGQYSKYRKRRHGNSSADRPAHQLVVFSQNHDQVGNRLSGDRLSQTQDLERLKLAAGAVILSPYIPLIFMGEEYGEKAPFHYFVSFGDPFLTDAVRRGREKEFGAFKWAGVMPDPQAADTFLSSKIDMKLRDGTEHKTLIDFYRELIGLRKGMPAFCNALKENMEVQEIGDRVLVVRRWFGEDDVFCLYNFDGKQRAVVLTLPAGSWEKILDSASKKWRGNGDAADALIISDGACKTIFLHSHNLVVYKMRAPAED